MMDYELDEMRQQMQTLKNKLEKQEIVNESIVRHSMKKSADSIARRYYILMAVALLMLPLREQKKKFSLQTENIRRQRIPQHFFQAQKKIHPRFLTSLNRFSTFILSRKPKIRFLLTLKK